MQGTNDVRKFVHGAEQAEARGDHAAAEQLLRRALVLQEFSLGAEHPEVANTLNNLAIVCEMNGKLGDAEACYRRAYTIAHARLAPNDPFVATSRENLQQFCEARGIPLNRQAPSDLATSFAPEPIRPPSPPPKPPVPPNTSAPPKATAPPKTAAPPRAASPSVATKQAGPPKPPIQTQTTTSPNAARSTPFADLPLRTGPPSPSPPAPGRTATALPKAATAVPVRVARQRPWRAIVLGLAAVGVVVAGGYWFKQSGMLERAASAPETSASPSAQADTTPPPATPEPAPSEPASAPAPQPEPEAVAAPAAEPAAPPPAPFAAALDPPPTTTRASSSVAVVTAQACRSLTRGNAWTCTPANGTQAPGRMYFYTRVASPRDTTIEHRWYRGDRLEQRVSLRIRANPAGYRTYSQLAISPDRAGSWKVELRAQDGHVLGEQTFSIR